MVRGWRTGTVYECAYVCVHVVCTCCVCVCMCIRVVCVLLCVIVCVVCVHVVCVRVRVCAPVVKLVTVVNPLVSCMILYSFPFAYKRRSERGRRMKRGREV